MRGIMIAVLLLAAPAEARRTQVKRSTTFDVRLTGYVERSMVVVIQDDGTVDLRGSGGCYDVSAREVDGVEMHEITPC